MNENDKNKEALRNYAYGLQKKYLSQNEKNNDLFFHVDYETLLKTCKREENYIDLNLEINYNLEEMMENKDNIKKCLYLNDIIDHENLYRKKSNENYIKNNKFYYNNNVYFNLQDKSSPFIYEKEKWKKKKKKNKNFHYRKYYNDENNSSYSSDTYCSNFSINSSEDENAKSMSFSQRITYDNNELIHNLNLCDKIINYNIYNKKYGKNSEGYSQTNKEKKENSNSYNTFFIKKINDEKYSRCKEKQIKIPNHDFPPNTAHKMEKNYSFLPNGPKSNFKEFNLENSSINLKFFKNSNSLNSKKMEEEILKKYEKVLKIMKYLRKIKTKYPKIETIVSILSNHIKNVTFSCEKMFGSRSHLNDFLKKIYIYQIFLLKKVVFKDQNIMKNNDLTNYENKNEPRNKIRFISTDNQNLREHSIVLDESNISALSMLHHMNKYESYNSHNKKIYEYIKKQKDEKLRMHDEIFRKKYENIDKREYEEQEIEASERKKGNSIDREDEHIKSDIYNEHKKNKNKYNESKIDGENVKNKYEDVIKDNMNNYKYKDIYKNYQAKDIEKKCSHGSCIKDKYNEDVKFMYETEENIKDKKKKGQVQKKNENILNTDYSSNKIITNQKTEKSMKMNEKGSSHIMDLFEKEEQFNKGCDIKKNLLNKNSNEYVSTNFALKEFYKNNNGNNLKNVAYKEREEELNLNAHALETNNSVFRNISRNEKHRKKSIDKEEKKTHVLYYDINKELTAISNRESVIHALKYTLLNKPQNFMILQNFLFKIDVELVDYKNFILLITKDIKEPHLEALYGLNDFSIFEKVYGKKVAPRFLVSSKVKNFYKYDKFYQTFKELTNVKDFSGITDAVKLI